MSQNMISAQILPNDVTEITTKLLDIRKKFVTINLSLPEDMSTLLKVGNTMIPFVDEAYAASQNHPEIIPLAFNKDEFVKDYQLLKTISAIVDQIDELHRSAERIYAAAAHDTMSGSLNVYDYVKQNKSKSPGLDAVADRMAVYFKKTHVKKSEETKK